MRPFGCRLEGVIGVIIDEGLRASVSQARLLDQSAARHGAFLFHIVCDIGVYRTLG